MAGELDGALGRLVSRGVLTPEQAAAVVEEFETGRPGGRLPPGAELAAWIGAVLAAAAGVTAATRFWAELAVWAQSALLALVSGGLLLAGRSTLPDHRPAARRITGATWLLATAAAAGAVGVPVAEAGGRDATPWLAAALAALALSLALWRVHEHALQLIAVAVAALATMLSALGMAERPPLELYGLAAWGLGAALLLLALGGIARPAGTGRGVAALLLAGGAQGLALPYHRVGTLLAVVTAAGLIWLGGLLSDAVSTAIAAIALAITVPQLVEAWFPGSLNAAATLFVSGVALLAGGLAAIRRARLGSGHAEAPHSGKGAGDATT